MVNCILFLDRHKFRRSIFIARGLITSAVFTAVLAGCSLLPNSEPAADLASGDGIKFIVTGVPKSLQEDALEQLADIGSSGPSRSILENRRRTQNAINVLEEFLAAEGYLAATVESGLIDNENQKPELVVTPGQRFTILSIALEGTDELPDKVLGTLKSTTRDLSLGSPARTQSIRALDQQLVASLQQSGYAFASSQSIDVLASRRESNVELTYTLSPGPLTHLGEIVLTDEADRPLKNLDTLRTWQVGNTYKPDDLADFRSRVRRTGLFAGIGVEIMETPDEAGNYPVAVTLSPAKLRTVSAGVSYSTTDGVGTSAAWERRNLTGRADTIGVDATLATETSHLRVTYKRPNIGRYGRNLTLEAGARHEELDAYDLTGIKVGGELSQPFNKNFDISAGAYIDATRSEDYLGERDQVSLSFPLSATYSTVKNPLDPQGGNQAFASLEPGISLGSSSANFTRLLTSFTTYRKVSNALIIAARAEAGSFIGDSDVPPDRRFFAGGGGSVRGFEYQSLSPRDAEGNYVGGDSLLNLSAELRWRKSEKYGYVAFVDSGIATNDPEDIFSELRTSFGIGVRYYPGFGPIRLDIATPVDRRDGEDPVHFYISIGQAF